MAWWWAAAAFAAPEESSPETPDLEPDAEIVVTGTRTPHRQGDAPVAVEVIDRETLESSGSQDVAEVLEQHPGIDVQRQFVGATVRLRGLEADHTLILVDGQRVVGRKDGTFDLSRISIDAIERIEIVKGASSALYGSEALGGVINIITRKQKDDLSGNVSVRGGVASGVSPERGVPFAGDLSGGVGSSKGAWSFRLDAGWHGNQPFDLDEANVATNGNGNRQGNVAARIGLDAGNNVDVFIRGSYSAVDSSGIDQRQAAILDRRNLTEDGIALFGVDATIGTSTRWNTTLGLSTFRDQFILDQREASGLDNYEETRELLGQLTSQLIHVFPTNVFTVGFEGFTSQLTAPTRIGGEVGSRQRGALFAQDEWTIGKSPRLVLVPGVRADLDSWFGGAIAPSVTLRFDPVKSLIIRASAGRGWRAPGFRELLLQFSNPSVGYQVVGNEDLQPESSISVQASVEWAPTDAFALSVQAHRDRVTNLIQVVPIQQDAGGLLFGYDNVNNALTQGIETTADWEPAEWLGLQGTFTFLDARDLDDNSVLPNRARLRGTASVEVGTGPSLRVRGVAVGSRNVGLQTEFNPDNPNLQNAPPYVLLDARGQWPLADAWTIFAGAENLTNAGDPLFLPTPPRLVYAGFDARL
ncbi:MAG: TonB-dependent receptor [Myxococcota bacterium]